MPSPVTAHPAFRAVVVDDVDDVRELISAGLEASGRFEVVGRAGHADAALALTAAEHPDIVLLDLAMPGVGGLDVLPELRAVSPSTRVVVVSGFPEGRLGELVAARGAVGYVEKGLSIVRLVDEIIEVAGVLEVVERVLAERRVRLDHNLRSGSVARRFVEETLARWDCAGVLDDVNLLVTELVTNAIVHGRSEPNVAVFLTPTSLRVEVADDDPALPQRRDIDEFDTSGRGMVLLESYAEAHGVVVRPDGRGKVVWFEVRRPDQQGSSS